MCRKCGYGTYSIFQPCSKAYMTTKGYEACMEKAGCQPCPAGYLCYAATNTNVPRNVTTNNGEICPKGAYCPEGSYIQELCPPGSMNPFFGARSLGECTPCTAGTSQALYGQGGCSPCGQFASSKEGSE